MAYGETWQQADNLYREVDLKICDLCGGLNLASNGECFVCGWRGRFETRPQLVRMAMELMIGRHGDLRPELLTDLRAFRRAASLGLLNRIRCLGRRVRHWLFG